MSQVAPFSSSRALKPMAVFFVSCLATSGCSLLSTSTSLPSPTTLAEGHSAHTYIPLDPTPVVAVCKEDDTRALTNLLRALPDQTVRLAVGQYNRSGTLSFGPVSVGVANQSYKVVLDYVNSDVTYLPLYVTRMGEAGKGAISLFETDTTVVTTGYTVEFNEDFPHSDPNATAGYEKTPVVIPVYVGLGLRLTATVTIGEANANLSSLGALAAEAEAGNLTGTLVVQTLGVTGRSVSTALPLPSELNRTTISNAILALGAIKATLYDPGTAVAPRVVGIYNPIGGGQALVSGIISTLAGIDLVWRPPCGPAPTSPTPGS